MRNYLLLMAVPMVLGCATARDRIRAVSPDTEVVEAEGMAPVIGSDLTGAKKVSLDEALKNALGLVIGIYVSQEALVAKAMLVEDNIVSQAEGYIERYSVLRESHRDGFYTTRIKALVRKEDLAAKLQALELEPQKLGNPSVRIAIEEFVDGVPSPARSVENEVKQRFVEQGFTVADTGEPDIAVSGRAESSFNTDAGLGGFSSYRATLSLSVVKSASSEVMATVSDIAGGADVTKEAAAKSALVSVAKKSAQELPSRVLAALRERARVQLAVSNVDTINVLNDLIKSVRSLVEVQDCRVRNYSNGYALVDLSMRKGTSSDVARRLEQLGGVKVRVKKTKAYDIEAELIK